MYTNILSLGYFCSTASELEKIGLRSFSSPFDWLITDFEGIISCIENNFEGFLNYDSLMQYKDVPNYYYEKKYKFHFYHDFNAHDPLNKQLLNVQEKYSRRINKFYNNIKEPTLFLRYISDKEELDYIEDNYEQIRKLLKIYNDKNELLLISNDDIMSNSLEIYHVTKDENDTVAREFLEKNADLKNYLNSNIYDEMKRVKNLEMHNRKSSDKNSNFLVKVKRRLKKKYKHESIYTMQ